MSLKLMGVGRLVRALNTNQKKHQKGMKRGLYRGGLYLQRESQKIVPVDKNVLRNSANTRVEGSGFTLACYVSYSTDYAIHVHENLEAQHKPGKQAKYLEEPLRTKREHIRREIRDGAK